MKIKSKGNLLVTFIILVAMSISVFAFLSFIGTRLIDSGARIAEVESFYAAEAGLNKAIWYLATPIAQGGKGFSWRTAGTSEAFGWGRYYFAVIGMSASNEVFIISTGEIHGISRTVNQIVELGGLPPAFDYAVYANTPINMSGNALIRGDIFINGNTHFAGSATVTDGYIYHPTGTTISGSGTYTDGGAPDPIPTLPVLDTSYYSGKITAAGGIAAGNKTYNNATVNLSGGDLLVNGDINISGTTTFNGPGNVVATGKIIMSGSTYGNNGVKFISSGLLNITGNTYTQQSIYYSASSITATGNTRVEAGAFISNNTMSIGGNINLSGLAYATGQLDLNGNPSIRGAIVAGTFIGVTGIGGSTQIVYDDSVFPDNLVPGFTPTSLERKKGTWKGD